MKSLVTAAALALGAYALCTHTASALQEETLEFEGQWKVQIQPATGKNRQAALKLSHYGGRWNETATAGARQGLCSSAKPYPITVQKSVTTELEFTVWSAAVSPGCANLSITVAPQGPKKLVGVSSDGRTITMTRQ